MARLQNGERIGCSFKPLDVGARKHRHELNMQETGKTAEGLYLRAEPDNEAGWAGRAPASRALDPTEQTDLCFKREATERDEFEKVTPAEVWEKG